MTFNDFVEQSAAMKRLAGSNNPLKELKKELREKLVVFTQIMPNGDTATIDKKQEVTISISKDRAVTKASAIAMQLIMLLKILPVNSTSKDVIECAKFFGITITEQLEIQTDYWIGRI